MRVTLEKWNADALPVRERVDTPEMTEHLGGPEMAEQVAARHARHLRAEETGDAWMFRKDTSEISVTVRGRLRLSAAEGVRSAVLAGMGLTIASEWMFSRELVSGAVRAVLTDWTIAPIDPFRTGTSDDHGGKPTKGKAKDRS